MFKNKLFKTTETKPQEQSLTCWRDAQEEFQNGYMTILEEMSKTAERYFMVESAETKRREKNDKALFQLIQADADIDFCKELIGDLYALLDIANLEMAEAMVGGKNQVKNQKKIITLNKQIHSAEQRLRKAQFCKYEAEQKLADM